jgi:hypothetical protein
MKKILVSVIVLLILAAFVTPFVFNIGNAESAKPKGVLLANTPGVTPTSVGPTVAPQMTKAVLKLKDDIPGVIDEAAKTVTFTVPAGSDLKSVNLTVEFDQDNCTIVTDGSAWTSGGAVNIDSAVNMAVTNAAELNKSYTLSAVVASAAPSAAKKAAVKKAEEKGKIVLKDETVTLPSGDKVQTRRYADGEGKFTSKGWINDADYADGLAQKKAEEADGRDNSVVARILARTAFDIATGTADELEKLKAETKKHFEAIEKRLKSVEGK